MDTKDLLTQAFEFTLKRAARDYKQGVFGKKIEIIFLDDSTEQGWSIEEAMNIDLKKRLLAERKQTALALSMSDAIFYFASNEEQMQKGLFEPGEGDKEPLMMSLWYSPCEGLFDDDTDAVLILFSCVPDQIDYYRAVKFKKDKKTKAVYARGTTIPDNAFALRDGWLRIMWGVNWKYKYGCDGDKLI